LKAGSQRGKPAEGDIVLSLTKFIRSVGAGGGEGAMDAANILKPALARGELRVKQRL
jgi:ATP-dependent Clp protease ATP-binding subunit ClpA